jgi:two-component system, cell cycle sensor histidine kinase and response regulator CckA
MNKTGLSKPKVLVVDDEAMICDLSFAVMQEMGYDVVTASDGRQAIDLCKKAKDENLPFDVILLDLTIHGGMGGLEALQNIRKLDPSVRAIATTGHSEHPIMQDSKKHGFIAVLCKPFKIAELRDTLLQILGR